jgi:hypothetical protein
VTGQVLRQIATFPGAELVRSLSVTGAGAHVLLAADLVGTGDFVNYRVDDGVVSQLSTHLDRLVW